MRRQFTPLDDLPWNDRYGTYGDGDKHIAADTVYDGANTGLVGAYTPDLTVANPTITVDDPSTFENGDLIIIHQTRGPILLTDAFANERWEFNKIKSGAGTTTFILEYPITLPYQDDGSGAPNQAQVLEVKSYGDVLTDSTKIWTPIDWDGNKGGIFFYFAKTITNNGIHSLDGKGFRGGISEFHNRGTQGEGIPGLGTYSESNNLDGGAGGDDYENRTGAGAGNKTSGSNGRASGVTIQGGAAYGNDSLSLGGPAAGGGSCGVDGGHEQNGPAGGDGGGFGGFWSPSITGTGT